MARPITTALSGAALATAAVFLPMISVPTAGADVCAGADGRHFTPPGDPC